MSAQHHLQSQRSKKTAPTLPKPAFSSAAATALLPTRLQNLVNATSRTPSPASSVSSGSSIPRRGNSPRISSNAPSSPPRFPPPPAPGPSSRTATSPVDAFRTRTPSNNFSSSPTNSSPLTTSRPSLDTRARTPSNNVGSRPSLDSRARTPSDQSARPSFDARARTPSNNFPPPSISPGRGPSPFIPPPRQGSYPVPRPPPTPEPSNAYGPPPIAEAAPNSELIDTKSGGEAGMAGVGRRGFAAAARAAMFALPHNAQGMYGSPGGPPDGMMDGRGTPFRQNAPAYLNTQAAEFSNPHARAGVQLTPPSPLSFRSQSSTPQASQRRTPSPGYNTNQATSPVAIPNTNMPQIPPLNTSLPVSTMSTSPSSNSSSAGPITPLATSRLPFFEKYKKGLPGSPAPTNDIIYDSNNRDLDKSATSDSNGSAGAPSPLNRSRSASTASNGLPSSPAASRSASSASSYSARTGMTRQRSNTTTSTSTVQKDTPLASIPASPSFGDEMGLAYADSGDEGDSFSEGGLLPFPGTVNTSPKPTPLSKTKSILRNGTQPSNERNHIRFPSISSDSNSDTSLKPTPRNLPTNRARVSVVTNSIYSDEDIDERMLRDSPKSSKGLTLLDRVGGMGGGSELESVMENLMEDLAINEDTVTKNSDPLLDKRSAPTRSKTVPGGSILPGLDRDSVKLPLPTSITRSRTAPSSGASAHEFEVKAKSAVAKAKKIKCRRCERPIETAAISSSDGQLKGKYHKECFNCFTCQKPFPDKTFYVFDGKPYCRYHYHEANESLCAAAMCGQPIEGPCAVSHSGDRYHPEHFLCEHPRYPCKTRLEEYWEVDGRMLCDKHAHTARSTFDGDESDYGDEEGDPVQNGKALKRVTRFIDLGDSGLR
ncbi:hypothetical protein ONZ45_g10051 [Pleurotus djamor]|nr:hypothetical protein ONZ45_g10051 [Pleurotus djamor]